MPLNKFSAILLALFVVPLSSCDKQADGELKLTFKSAISYILPTERTSCYQLLNPPSTGTSRDVPADSFELKNINLEWTNTTDTLDIISMSLTIKHAGVGGNFTQIAGPDEIGAVFASATPKAAWNGQLSPTVKTKDSTCTWAIGGVKIVNRDLPFTTYATVKIIGIQTSSNGDQKAVSATDNVQVVFQGGI